MMAKIANHLNLPTIVRRDLKKTLADARRHTVSCKEIPCHVSIMSCKSSIDSCRQD